MMSKRNHYHSLENQANWESIPSSTLNLLLFLFFIFFYHSLPAQTNSGGNLSLNEIESIDLNELSEKDLLLMEAELESELKLVDDLSDLW